MKKTFSRRLLLPDGATTGFDSLTAGDQLQIRSPETGLMQPKQPLLGYARTPDGLLLYVPGPAPVALRTATEHAPAFVQEEWFGAPPATITEICPADYAAGDVLRYPVTGQAALPFMHVA